MTAGGVEREWIVIDDVLAEVRISIKKHGEQSLLPLGTGAENILVPATPGDPHGWTAAELAHHFKTTTDKRSASQGNATVSWLDILLEEVFEAAEESNLSRLRAELVQVQAVSLKMCVAIDRRLGDGA